jgi:hypothetical protein
VNREYYRYRFRRDVALREAEDTLLLAILAAEGLFGEAQVRMDAGYAVDASIQTIIVDASTDVGQAVSAIFTAFILREFGRHAVDVRRVEGVGEGRR